MRRWVIVGLGMLAMGGGMGCSDRLADMQDQLKGMWVLESRQLDDGTLIQSPLISGAFLWVPIDSRKAHVTLNVLLDEGDRFPRTFDYAASTYEVSTSAITRKRHLLIRQGYRSSAESPISDYSKAKTAKGKISVEEEGVIKISHERGFYQEFKGDTMIAAFPGMFTDTWKRIR